MTFIDNCDFIQKDISYIYRKWKSMRKVLLFLFTMLLSFLTKAQIINKDKFEIMEILSHSYFYNITTKGNTTYIG